MKPLSTPKLTTIAVVITASLVIVILLGFNIWQVIHPASKQPIAIINNHQFTLTVAATPAQQQRGLGGVQHLDPNRGMYFPLTGQTGVAFWMKDMFIPIDIIWIKNHHIVGINANVPPPDRGTSDQQLPLYYAPVNSPDAVLEIAANRAAQLNIKPGDTISLSSH